jgi:DNA polymerase-1
MNKKYIVDLETDGLLQEVTKIHCISVVDLNSSWSKLYLEKDVAEFIKLIDDPSVELIGHNIFNYDLKVIEKLFGWKPHKEQKIHDTFILAQLLFSDLKNDDKNNTGTWSGKIFTKAGTGSHSLRSWGQRIHQYKGEYDGGWECYNDAMGSYCIQDTYTTKGLFQFLQSQIPNKLLTTEAIELEYSIAPILARQQAYGVLFDQGKARELLDKLTARLVEVRWELQAIFKPRYVSKGEFVPKRNDKNKGYVAGRAFTKIAIEEFNPGSRIQIVSRLKQQFNWNPEEFTEAGNVKMNEDIIDALPFKELMPLKEYLTITKRISQLETGAQAWLNKIGKDGRIRGGIMQNGTSTGRMSHWAPNLAQVPSNDSLYGKECRELFTVPNSKVMLGVDADALEMRCLAGYLTKLDNGRFLASLLSGTKEAGTDPHSINADAMGIPRDVAKTVFYAWLYGAKNAKIGKTLLESGIDFNEYVPNFRKDADGMLEWARERGSEKSTAYWECWIAGKECLKRFGDRIPELAELKKVINERVKEVKFIKGLDGRKLFMRSEHAELNTVLQSAGAILMKKALHIADTELQKQFTAGKDYEFILNVHDEWQLELDKSVDSAIVRNIVENSIKQAGEYFKFPAEMKGNSEVGSNWGVTH